MLKRLLLIFVIAPFAFLLGSASGTLSEVDFDEAKAQAFSIVEDLGQFRQIGAVNECKL